MEKLNVIRFSQFLEAQQSEIDSLIEESIIKSDIDADKELRETLDSLIESESSNAETKSSDGTEFLQPSDDYQGAPEVEDSFDPPVDIEDFSDYNAPEELDETDSLPEPEYEVEKKAREEGPGEEEVIKSEQIDEELDLEYYEIFRDKPEDFTCELKIEGANLEETEVRLVLESENWNVMFKGNVDVYGRCLIPLKRLSILNEGESGTIKLEVIAENTVFVPWEEVFKIKTSKKVSAALNESKKEKKKVALIKPSIKMNTLRRK